MTEEMSEVYRLIVEDFAETSRKEKEMKDEKKSEEKGKTRLMQVFLEVKGAEHPKVVLRPASDDSYPANLVLLKDVVVEVADDKYWSEDDAWKVCGKIADKCREVEECEDANMSGRNAICEHLTYAYCILCDYLRETEGDWLMSKETSETLIRGAIERLVWAGKCIGFKLDEYRSDG